MVGSLPAQSVTAHNEPETAYLQYVAAWKAKDFATLNRVIADDYSTLNGEGKLANKAAELAEAKSDEPYSQMEVVELHSHLIGTTAVLSGVLTVAGTSSGKPYTARARFLATLIQRNGKWQIVADESAPAS